MGFYQSQRKERFDKILAYIKENQPVKEEKLNSELQIDFGLSEETADKHIDTLKDAEKITIQDGMVSVPENVDVREVEN